jgi:hypothetical protein
VSDQGQDPETGEAADPLPDEKDLIRGLGFVGDYAPPPKAHPDTASEGT